ncbi:putative histidine acid phosphatase family protein [Lyophyllum shimeji]|uniref:Histidine acid phosphatase family protein n=1 Tax=Lyophyllum shimeji TaxID=47721 RepID=A0A9P3PNJ4_LYOSH|nr:putative histidine acid phosphatase family protein [Lyophyllum shimeji]
MKQCDAGTSNVYRTPQVPLDTEHYPVAPAVLELKQVHVYVRHGERTPVGVRLSRPPASIPEHWMMCETARQFQTAVTNTTKDEFLRSRRVVERVDGVAAGAECLLGELTDLGRQSTYNFGKSLRGLYVQKLGFLPDRLSNKEQVYFRSTNIPRTIESLQQAIHGLYPTEKCETGVLPDILVRNTKDENLLGNTYACKRLEILQLGFAQAAATAYNPTLEPLDARIAKYLDGKPIRVDGKPRASGIMDTVRAAIAHGIEVPPEFEDKSVVDVIERAVVSEWFAGCKAISLLVSLFQLGPLLGMGRLLDDLASKMQHKADKGTQDPLKILVHSTHDTALAALCSTLDVFDDQWPAFTASITFELFKKRAETRTTGDASLSQTVLSSFRSKPTTEHFVRMRYQNKNMVLPFCADEGKHLPGSPEFCALAAFRERVRELTPRNFEAECAPAGRSG